MIVLSGASACGKTEVAHYLYKKYGINRVITTTTRKKRKGEEDGKDYFFITIKEFEKKIKNNDFVEHMAYNGNLYGSTKDQIADDKCLVVDSNGLKSYIELNNQTVVSFFLITDEPVRFERMMLRGDDKKVALQRLKEDQVIFNSEHVQKVDFKINTTNISVEQVGEFIYKNYIKTLEKRGLAK